MSPAVRRLRDDREAGVFQIVEAILVAVLVATALIFFALVQKPPAGSSAEGQDLAQAAADALDILAGQGSLAPLARRACATPTPTATDLGSLVPPGISYVLFKTNATAARCAVAASSPTAATSIRNAQAASAYALDSTGTPRLTLLDLVVWNGL